MPISYSSTCSTDWRAAIGGPASQRTSGKSSLSVNVHSGPVVVGPAVVGGPDDVVAVPTGSLPAGTELTAPVAVPSTEVSTAAGGVASEAPVVDVTAPRGRRCVRRSCALASRRLVGAGRRRLGGGSRRRRGRPRCRGGRCRRARRARRAGGRRGRCRGGRLVRRRRRRHQLEGLAADGVAGVVVIVPACSQSSDAEEHGTGHDKSPHLPRAGVAVGAQHLIGDRVGFVVRHHVTPFHPATRRRHGERPYYPTMARSVHRCVGGWVTPG